MKRNFKENRTRIGNIFCFQFDAVKFIEQCIFKLRGDICVCRIEQLNEISIGEYDIVLVPNRFDIEIVRNDGRFDYIDNWINSSIDIDLLRQMKCEEYIDYLGNRIVYSMKAKGKFVFSRILSKGKTITSNSVCRIGKCIVIQDCVEIYMWGNKPYFRVGDGSTLKALIVWVGKEQSVEIGEDCMFAKNISIKAYDGHLIFDAYSHKKLNNYKNVKIGNHVWLCQDVTLLGGASIPDGCIVGMRCVTASSFSERNSIIVGNPGSIVKHNCIWSRDEQWRDYDIIEDCIDQNALMYI